MQQRLAILDWGIGGLSVLKELRAQIGDVPVLYFSDTGAMPYGKMTRVELVARLHTVIAWLKTQGVTHLIIGCNAASTAIPYLKVEGMQIEGVIESAVRQAVNMRPSRLALIGGRRTVVSGVYRKALAERGVAVTQRIAQPLSALIEKGDVSSNHLRAECRRILAPIRYCSHLLLACTHYPAISLIISEIVSDNVKQINPAHSLIKQIKSKQWLFSDQHDPQFITTGDAQAMRQSALKAFNIKTGLVNHIRI